MCDFRALGFGHECRLISSSVSLCICMFEGDRPFCSCDLVRVSGFSLLAENLEPRTHTKLHEQRKNTKLETSIALRSKLSSTNHGIHRNTQNKSRLRIGYLQ